MMLALIAMVSAGLLFPTPPLPPLEPWPIPYGQKRKREMAEYSARHYGERTWRLRRPRVIVEHMAQAGSAAAVYSTFAPDVPDPELHELPNVCAHFVVSPRGRTFRLVNLRTRCRHTVGLNWTAIGIEHVGYGDGDVLGNRRALRASLRLTDWLRCRFRIRVGDVIGHAESLRSPYHRERVPSLRRQTHGDWSHAAMRVYRKKLRRFGRCPGHHLRFPSPATAGIPSRDDLFESADRGPPELDTLTQATPARGYGRQALEDIDQNRRSVAIGIWGAMAFRAARHLP